MEKMSKNKTVWEITLKSSHTSWITINYMFNSQGDTELKALLETIFF